MILQGQPGIQSIRQVAGNPNVAQGYLAEMLSSQLDPIYYAAAKMNRVFSFSLTGATSTAFTGAAGGTPLLGIMNPPNSGYDIVVLHTRVGFRTYGTGTTGILVNWYGGPSVVPTGTLATTGPRNQYSLQLGSGSVARCFSNTAMTSSTAINIICSSQSLGVTSGTAGIISLASLDQNQGTVVAAPGNLIALGIPVALTSPSIDACVVWMELPA